MNCCEKCFSDEFLEEFVRKNGKKIKACDFCGAENVYGLDPEEIGPILSPLIGLYTPINEFYPMEYLKENDYSGEMIWDKLSEEWGVFDDSTVGERIINYLYPDDPRDGTYHEFTNGPVDIEDDWYEHEGLETSKAWEKFCKEIKHENRFFPKSFHSEILTLIADANKKVIPKNFTLYRARIEHAPKAYKKSEMGNPPPEIVKFGRMNPQGISYLYLSGDEVTCGAEVRPTVADSITIGTFKTNAKLNLVDVIEPHIGSPFKYGEQLQYIYRAKGFLKSLGNTLSLPVSNEKSYLEYIPSQYVCEFIKHLGYDGLIYRSTLSNGLNYILFQNDKVRCTEVKSIKKIKIKYSFS